jgi:hypothetical protein
MTDLAALLDSVLGPLAAALLTLMVLSYLIGDNPLFRIAAYLFIGVASGYAGVVVIRSVLWPALIDPVLQAGVSGLLDPGLIASVLLPGLLVVLLLFKLSPGSARLGSPSLALLLGVAAAVVVGGAITGTLLPQAASAVQTLNPAVVAPRTGEAGIERLANVIIVLTGTLLTLASFRFTQRKPAGSAGAESMGPWQRGVRAVAGLFIAITFGVMFGGALMAAIVVLAQRLQFLWGAVLGLIGQLLG